MNRQAEVKVKPLTKKEQESNCAEAARLAEGVNGKPCTECNGSGHGAWDLKNNVYELCNCVLKAGRKVREEKTKAKLPVTINPEEEN